VADLLAFIDDKDTYEAFVYGPGHFSARRDPAGVWASPAPAMTFHELHERFKRIDDAESAKLLAEAQAALADPYNNRPRATPAQLMVAAKDYNRRREEVVEAGREATRAVDKAMKSAKASAMPPKPRGDPPSP
jgi:hypothetical protein